MSFIFHLWTGGELNAQVTIGSGIKPNEGALLDLKEKNPVDPAIDNSTANRGLGLPRVNLTSLTTLSDISEAVGKEIQHTGLMVYNINTVTASNISPGIYIWNGTQWVKGNAETSSCNEFYYMPSFNLPLPAIGIQYYPIYMEYQTQFIKAGLPVHPADKIEFRVTYNDPALITDISFPAEYGNEYMKYDVVSTAAPAGSFINIIITVK